MTRLHEHLSVDAYVARQPRYGWRRFLLRELIRTLGYRVLWDVTITGTEYIPRTGGVILMMNHTALIDPIICLGAVPERYVVPMSKQENMDNPLFGFAVWFWGAYTVNRGEADRKALLNSIALLQNGCMILIAPEGTRHHALSRPHDGMAYVATKADAQIVPAALSGTIGWDAAMKQFRRPRIRLNFGRAFRFRAEAGKRASRDQLAAMTDEAMYQLALALPDPALRGIYADVEQATTEHLSFVS